MLLVSSTDKWQILLGASVQVTAWDWTAEYVDRDSSGNITAYGHSDGTVSGSTPVTIATGPASGTRELWHFSVVDLDALAVGGVSTVYPVTVEYVDASSVVHKIIAKSLPSGMTLLYALNKGWYVWGER